MKSHLLRLTLPLCLGLLAEAAPRAQPAPDEPGDSRAAAAISEAEGRALLERWRVAQNQGRFDDYRALYAERMTGVRRSGPRTVRLSRDGWLKDRARMFKKPMTVEVSDVVVQPRGALLKLRFRQRWASGAYADVGDKEILLVRGAGPGGAPPLIAREELLSSQVAGAGGLPPAGFFFVHPRGVVLAQEAQAGLGQGKPALVAHAGGGYWTEKPVAPGAAVPKEAAAQLGARLQVLDFTGKVCESAVGGLRLLSWAEPHFGMVQTWEGAEGGKRYSKAQVAKEAWELGSKLLLGQLDAACARGVFAVPAGAKAPQLRALVQADDKLRAQAVAALRQLGAYRKLQAEYDKAELQEARKPRWEQYRGGALAVQVVEAAGVKLVIATARGGEVQCDADFSGQVQAIWEVGPGGALTLRNRPGESGVLSVRAAGDVDGDGKPELLYEPQGLLRLRGETFEEAGKLEMPSFDCPC